MQNFAGKNAIVHSMENEFKQMLSTISHSNHGDNNWNLCQTGIKL